MKLNYITQTNVEIVKRANIYDELNHVDSLSFSRTNTTRSNKLTVLAFVRSRPIFHRSELVPLKARVRTARRNKRTRRPRSG